MGKADIQSAFRLLPVYPDDFELLGMRVDGLYYYDRCLPMGCSASCAIFERFSTFLEYCCRQIAESECILHYLDDFFFAASSLRACSKLMHSFFAMCERFGVPVADDKTMGPVRSIEYLGLVIDSISFEVQVPVEKVRTLQADIAKVIACDKVSLRSLQSLIGKLNFVCRAVTPGRAFLRRLIDLTRGVGQPYHKVRITCAAREDLRAWLAFLTRFNGTVMRSAVDWTDNSILRFYTDASGSVGFGIYFAGKWAQGRWPPHVLEKKYSIAFLEFLPIVVGVQIWGEHIANQKVMFCSDNQSVVHVINKQTSRCPHIMRILRVFVVCCLAHNIWFKARYVPGAKLFFPPQFRTPSTNSFAYSQSETIFFPPEPMI